MQHYAWGVGRESIVIYKYVGSSIYKLSRVHQSISLMHLASHYRGIAQHLLIKSSSAIYISGLIVNVLTDLDLKFKTTKDHH